MGVTDSGDEEDFEVKENTSSGMKIIDMTGKEQRVITDTRQLPSQKPNKKNKHKGSDDDSSSSSSSDESEDEIDKGRLFCYGKFDVKFFLKSYIHNHIFKVKVLLTGRACTHNSGFYCMRGIGQNVIIIFIWAFRKRTKM
jgi:hypothetical protein